MVVVRKIISWARPIADRCAASPLSYHVWTCRPHQPLSLLEKPCTLREGEQGERRRTQGWRPQVCHRGAMGLCGCFQEGIQHGYRWHPGFRLGLACTFGRIARQSAGSTGSEIDLCSSGL